MPESLRPHAVAVVAVDPLAPGMDALAETLGADRCAARARAVDLAIREASMHRPDARRVVVVSWRTPGLIVEAWRRGADRVAVFFQADPDLASTAAVWLRALLAIVDRVIVTDEDGVRAAVKAGADPERTTVVGPGLVARIALEPRRRQPVDGGLEVAASLALDALETTGLLGLIERRARKQGANIVNYHRVLPVEELRTYGRPQMAIPAPLFEAQLEAFRRGPGIAPLEAVGTAEAQGQVAITFDDGYEDNYRVALPILKAAEASATVFIVTGLIGAQHALWWDRVGAALFAYWQGDRATPVGPELPRRARALEAEPSFVGARAIISDVLGELNFWDEARREDAVRAAIALGGGDEGPRTMLSWDEVRAMHEAGVGFGGHTQNHVVLSEVPTDVAREEFFGSQRIVEAQLGLPADAKRYAALPRGVLGPIDPDSLREAGIDAVMTTTPGLNPSTPGELMYRRRDGNYLTLRGRHHPAKLRLELSGLLDPLRGYGDQDP